MTKHITQSSFGFLFPAEAQYFLIVPIAHMNPCPLQRFQKTLSTREILSATGAYSNSQAEMPFQHISSDIKQRFPWILDNAYYVNEVCYILNVSERSIRRWAQHYHNCGHVILLIIPTKVSEKFLRRSSMKFRIGLQSTIMSRSQSLA